MDGAIQCAFRADDDHQAAAAADGGVKEVALEHDVVLVVKDDHRRRLLAALRRVNRAGIGGNDVPNQVQRNDNRPVVETDGQLTFLDSTEPPAPKKNVPLLQRQSIAAQPGL